MRGRNERNENRGAWRRRRHGRHVRRLSRPRRRRRRPDRRVARRGRGDQSRRASASRRRTARSATIPVRASSSPAEIGPVDLIVNFVKCYSTEAAIRSAAPLLGEQHRDPDACRTAGATPIASRRSLAETRVMVGLTYNSGTLLAPGRIKHSGIGSDRRSANSTASRRQDWRPRSRPFGGRASRRRRRPASSTRSGRNSPSTSAPCRRRRCCVFPRMN